MNRSDLKARGDAGNNRFDRQKERAQNMAAFGEDGASLNQGYNGAPRRRGGGRGGRGGYRVRLLLTLLYVSTDEELA